MPQPQGQLADRSVLIVDDESDIRESVETVFKAEGARTRTVSDGNSAVRICLDEKPDLVVLDMMLPGRSGFLVLEKIKGYEDSPVVIMITANEGKRHRSFATGLGADLYLQKPFSMDVLVEKSVELLKQADEVKARAGSRTKD
ncbi:MAG: response regulator [Phycisphaerales bacterium]|nr:response regulator [Phycisphaerales bacterium]